MDFSNPNSDVMLPILSPIGLAGDTVSARANNTMLRSLVIDRGLLFAMNRPTDTARGSAQAYLHPTYTEASLKGAPHLGDISDKKSRLQAISSHLEAFALQDEACKLIGEAITTHYNRIADYTVRLKDVEGAWIPAHITADGVDPLSTLGVIVGKVQLDRRQDICMYQDPSGRKRRYYRIAGIAPYINWAIPGITTQETQASILDAFEATSDPARAIDPRALFMASKLLGFRTSVSKVFDS